LLSLYDLMYKLAGTLPPTHGVLPILPTERNLFSRA
jgi:hypothetical protein